MGQKYQSEKTDKDNMMFTGGNYMYSLVLHNRKYFLMNLMSPVVFLQSCSLSFSPTNSSNEGPYAVQLVMEDFPRQTITLTQTNCLQVVKTTNNALSKLPVQFVLRGKISSFSSRAEVRNNLSSLG